MKGNLNQIDDEPEVDTRLLWAGLFFAMAVYAKFPSLDLLIASHYYQPEIGFIHRQDPAVLALYQWTPWIGRGLVLVLFLFWVLNRPISALLQRLARSDWAQRSRGPWRHMAAITVVCALLGPGLVIEGVFKNVMGRPRPVQVIEFGGTEAFHGPFQPGSNPDRHRSFVSSHAAAGFVLMSLGLTCGHTWRRRWLLISIVTGGVIGLGRMMQGGHFFSDILFSFYAVWLSCELVSALDRRRLAKLASN